MQGQLAKGLLRINWKTRLLSRIKSAGGRTLRGENLAVFGRDSGVGCRMRLEGELPSARRPLPLSCPS